MRADLLCLGVLIANLCPTLCRSYPVNGTNISSPYRRLQLQHRPNDPDWTYERPIWWDFVVGNEEAFPNLRRCFKRQYPPTPGLSCSRFQKTCLFGLKVCPGGVVAPTTRCICNGDITNKGTWSCEDLPCPTLPLLPVDGDNSVTRSLAENEVRQIVDAAGSFELMSENLVTEVALDGTGTNALRYRLTNSGDDIIDDEDNIPQVAEWVVSCSFACFGCFHLGCEPGAGILDPCSDCSCGFAIQDCGICTCSQSVDLEITPSVGLLFATAVLLPPDIPNSGDEVVVIDNPVLTVNDTP